MLDEAHYALHALEGEHFWYVGARAVYRVLLKIGLGAPKQSRRILEVGSGSGGNLPLLEEYGPAVGLDVAWLAFDLAESRPSIGLVQASANALPFADASFEGVALLGLIEHLEDDRQTLSEARRVCRSQGAVVLLTSALPILWSHHDDANLHHRRYTRTELQQKLKQAGLRPLRLSYQNFFTFIPTLLVRLWQRRTQSAPRYDMGTPSKLVNALLTRLLKLEAWLIRYIPLPIGVDLVAACRPDTGNDKR